LLFVAVNTVYIKFLFRMVFYDKVVYWIVLQTLLKEARPVPSLCLRFCLITLGLVLCEQLALLQFCGCFYDGDGTLRDITTTFFLKFSLPR